MTTDFGALNDTLRRDLLLWYNLTEPTDEDKQRLADLFNAGRFGAWDCPRCQDRVYCGTPEDWAHFQGVRQADYASYPVSDKHPYSWCDSCRAMLNPDEPSNQVGVMPWDDPEMFEDA